MSDANTLGSLVRKRRLESGYSLGQLASKVGKTAAEVRAWERDSELPEHGIIERLASTLEIDLDEIKKRLESGKKALEAERKAAEKAAAVDETPESEPETPVIFPKEDVPQDEESSEDVPQDEESGEQPEEDLPGFAVDDPFTPPPQAAEGPDVEAWDEEHDLDLLDAPTEPVPVPVITDTAAAARAGRAAVMLEEPPPARSPHVGSIPAEDAGLLRYLEPVRVLFDPHSPYLYWIRAGLTVVVLLVFAAILFAQLGNLLDAIGELLDTIEPVPTQPEDLDALGL